MAHGAEPVRFLKYQQFMVVYNPVTLFMYLKKNA